LAIRTIRPATFRNLHAVCQTQKTGEIRHFARFSKISRLQARQNAVIFTNSWSALVDFPLGKRKITNGGLTTFLAEPLAAGGY
jgi:hypothetical protein